MEPEEFIEKWGATRQQIADICRVQIGAVHHWLSPKSPRRPDEIYRSRLKEVDWLFDHWRSQEDDRIQDLRQIYDDLPRKN